MLERKAALIITQGMHQQTFKSAAQSSNICSLVAILIRLVMLCSVPLFLFYKREITGAIIFFMSGLCQLEAGMGKITYIIYHFNYRRGEHFQN